MKSCVLFCLMALPFFAQSQTTNKLASYEIAFQGGVVSQKARIEIRSEVFENTLLVRVPNGVLMIIDHPDFDNLALDEDVSPCVLRKGGIDPASNRRKWFFDRWQ